MLDSTKIVLSPTWKQSVEFASERGDHLTWVIIGIILSLAFVVVLLGAGTNSKWFPKIGAASNVLLFVLLVGGLSSLLWQPSQIRWNNDKVLDKAHVDQIIKDSGSVKPIWDSLRSHCLIVGGPYDCYQK
jgi:uncharacterized membrane protein YkgB